MPGTLRFGARVGHLLLGFSLFVGLAAGSVAMVGTGRASAAVQPRKATITTKNCTTEGCLITLTVKAAVPVTPTGTVMFDSGGTAIAAAGGGECSDVPMVPRTMTSASATCDATGLTQGRDKVTATYSGDSNVDLTNASKTIRVKGVKG
jgi:hypothetical protein